jgi:hypothetical protein
LSNTFNEIGFFQILAYLQPPNLESLKKVSLPSLTTPPTTGVGEDAGKRNPLTLLVGM